MPPSAHEADGYQLVFKEPTDIRGGDTVVFGDGSVFTVNGVSDFRVAVLGQNPARAPRKHSGRAPPLWESDGVTPYGSKRPATEEEES